MNVNLGTIDRILRAVLGLVLIGLALAGTIGAWGYIGVLPLSTAVISRCPAYALLGWSSCKPKSPASR